jgi:hypothetical protein
MKIASALGSMVCGLALAAGSLQAHAQSFSEGFDGSTMPTGWVTTNLSTRASTGNTWSVGAGIKDNLGNIVVGPYAGAGFAIVNYTSVGSGTGTISNWLITPELFGIGNGDTISFLTTTTPGSTYPDRLELRLSTNGASVNVGATATSVGDFGTLLSSVNSTLATGGYPENWTLVTATVSGLAAPVDGRLAFRYFVTSGGPSGVNSNIIGVDNFSYTSMSAVPEPASWAISLAGMCGLIALRRLRRSDTRA